jgi:hypothetical protein
VVDNARRSARFHFESRARSKRDLAQIRIARDAIKIQRDGEISRQTRSSRYPTYSGRTQLLARFIELLCSE